MRTFFAALAAAILAVTPAGAQQASAYYIAMLDEQTLFVVDMASLATTEPRQITAVVATRERNEVIRTTIEFNCPARESRRTQVSVFAPDGAQKDVYVPENQNWRAAPSGTVGGDILDWACGVSQPRAELLLEQGEGAIWAFVAPR